MKKTIPSFKFAYCLSGLILLILATASGKAPANIRYREVAGVRYLYARDIAAFYGMSYCVNGKELMLSSKYSRLLFKQDSRVFNFNGINTYLSFAPTQNNREMLIASSDFLYLIDPILRPQTLARKKIRHIVIDPGHGGNDPGAQVGKITEKSLNLSLGRRTAAILRKRGFKVTMTRDGDQNVSLAQRAQLTQKVAADLFVSIHCNAAGSSSVQGIETYASNPRYTPAAGSNSIIKRKNLSNDHDRDSACFAFLMQRKLLQASFAVDRGIKRKQFYVIREVSCPALLLELGFMTNNTELRRLREQVYQDSLSVAICDAIEEFQEKLSF